MENRMVATLPIKPQKKTNIGMFLAPTIMDYIGTGLNIRRIMSINTLNTYDDKDSQINTYLDSIKRNNISYDSLFIDGAYADRLLEFVEKLYFDGIIKVKYENIMRCVCGKVDLLYNSINSNAKLYEEKNGKFYCKNCGSECKLYKEKSLVFTLNKDIDDSVSLTPAFLKKEMIGFSNFFKGTEILVSKQRNTGFFLDALHGKFNIDIDFLWSNYFNLFEENNQILIASNHQLFIMYLMNYISKISSEKQLHFIASPYVYGNLEDTMEKYNLKYLEAYKKLFILYNLRWNSKDCKWSDTVYDYLSGVSDTKLNNLYKTMLISAKDFLNQFDNIETLINQVLVKETNMQENIKLMKRFYKEGKL